MSFELPIEQLIDVMGTTLTMLTEESGSLLAGNNSNERSIVFRLAIYMREQFAKLEKQGIYIDCEYNRQGEPGNSKMENPDLPHDTQTNKCITPDIVLHKRGNDKNNIIYLEAKRCDCQNGDDAKKVLQQVIGTRKYQYGVYIYKLNQKNIELSVYTKDSGETPLTFRHNAKANLLEERENG